MSALLGRRGAVFYDGACGHCRQLAELIRRPLARRGIRVVPLQADGVAQTLGPFDGDLLAELRMVDATGRRLAGAEAVVAIAREIPLTRGLGLLAATPGAMPMLRYAYRRVAARRRCTPAGSPSTETRSD